MGDRTCFQLQIADCPADQASAILEIIDAHGLSVGIDDAPNILRLGERYACDETLCGTAEEVAAELQSVAPDASWECWEDPKYEWLGDLYRFTPDLGVFTAACDGEGQPRFTPLNVRQFMKKAAAIDETELRRSLGETHKDALAEKIKKAHDESCDHIAIPAAS